MKRIFEYVQDNNENEYYYLFKEKLSNNQTLELKFYEDFYGFFTCLRIYSKRKSNYTDFDTTGHVGIKSLILAKLGMELFIDFLIQENIKNKKIVVHWGDNRRQRVYYRGLKSLGFKYEYLEIGNKSKKFLTKSLSQI
jgi:hypothetical protein